MGTVSFSAKRSNPHAVDVQYAVGVNAKGSTHTVGLRSMYAVCSRF